jgi:hypothetical protein
MGISNLNHEGGKLFRVDNSEFSYIHIKELVPGREYPLFGCFVSKDNGYGEGAVLITAEYNVNVPARYIQEIRQILAAPEMIRQINDGKAAFKYTVGFSEKYKKDMYLITWIDR